MTNPVRAGSASPATSAHRVRLNGHRVESAVEAPRCAPRLQAEATGTLHNQPFRVTGGYVFLGARGFWTEWHLALGDGNTAWLTEQGDELLVREEVELPDELPDLELLAPGATCLIAGESFTLMDRQSGAGLQTLGAPAEALDPRPQNVTLESREACVRLDLAGAQLRMFLCERIRLVDLDLSRDCGPEVASALNIVRCPGCAGEMPALSGLFAYGVCPCCGAGLDLSGGAPTVLRTGTGRKSKTMAGSSPQFTLSLGATAHLLGSRYMVVGAVKRQAHALGDPCSLTSYHLFSEQAGSMTLLERSDGTWAVAEPCLQSPTYNSSDAWLDGAHFRLGRSYVATVEKAAGSLPGAVAEGDAHQAMEFQLEGLGGGLRDGTRLVRELHEETLRWQLYQPLDPKTVLGAFSAEAPAVAAPRKRPVAVARTRLADLRGPLKLALWGNVALWVVNPEWLVLLLAGAAAAGIVSLAWFSWLFEGERL